MTTPMVDYGELDKDLAAIAETIHRAAVLASYSSDAQMWLMQARRHVGYAKSLVENAGEALGLEYEAEARDEYMRAAE